MTDETVATLPAFRVLLPTKQSIDQATFKEIQPHATRDLASRFSKVKYELPRMSVAQALEILSNGDCAD